MSINKGYKLSFKLFDVQISNNYKHKIVNICGIKIKLKVGASFETLLLFIIIRKQNNRKGEF